MRALGRGLLTLILLALVGVLVFYKHPIWTERQATHLGLFFSHIQSNYVVTPAGRVHYYEAESRVPGGGIPIVLVHGAGDRGESWAPMMKRLKRAGFHVYAPDLLGYGRSPRPENADYSIAGEAQFVADFIQALGLQKPNVGGQSMGGWIVLKLALDHPDLVDRVVVYDSAGVRAGMPDVHNAFHIQSTADVDALYATMEPEAKPLPDFVKRDVVRSFADVQPTIDRNMAAMLGGKDLLDDRLGQLTNPLLIVWGATDRLTPLAVGQAMHAAVKNSELDIAEGCGHLAAQRCSSRLAAATADFLRANPPPAGGERTLTDMQKAGQ